MHAGTHTCTHLQYAHTRLRSNWSKLYVFLCNEAIEKYWRKEKQDGKNMLDLQATSRKNKANMAYIRLDLATHVLLISIFHIEP